MPAKLVDQAIIRNLLIGVAVIATFCTTGSIASAQLRSGQVERSLYRPTSGPTGSKKVAAKTQSGTRQSNVVRAASWQDAESIEPKVMPQVAPSVMMGDAFPMDDLSSMAQSSAGCDSCGSSEIIGGSMLGGCASCDSCNAFPVEPLDPCSPVNWLPSLRQPMYFDGPIARILTSTAVRGELMVFNRSGQDLPALVSTGALPGATVLFGNDKVGDQGVVGGRITASMWLDSTSELGIVGRYWSAGKSTIDYSTNSATNPTFARPFLNVGLTTPAPGNFLVSEAGATTGTLNASVTSEIDGADVMLRRLLGYDVQGRWDFLAGFQTLQLNEQLLISSNTVENPPSTTSIAVTDRFTTHNRFNGGLLGVQSFYRRGRWSLDGLFKLGMGNMERNVTIAGSTITRTSPTDVTPTSNGLLARSTNSGNYISDTFVLVPEFNLTIGYRLRSNLELTLGYTYMNVPKVAQAGNQIDPQLASNLNSPLTGPVRPAFSLIESDVSLNAFSAGLQWNY